jgi:hypothetical protein
MQKLSARRTVPTKAKGNRGSRGRAGDRGSEFGG